MKTNKSRRSKFPPRIVDGVDVNETAHRLAEQAIVEVQELQRRSKRLRGAIKSITICRQAGADLSEDLVDQLGQALASFSADLRTVFEGSA